MVYSMTEKTIYGVRVNVFPGSAETLVRRGWMTDHLLIAYCVSNISAKNYQNWLMCIEVIVCNISVVCFEIYQMLGRNRKNNSKSNQ